MLEQIVETTFDEMIIEYIPIVFGGTLLLGLTWVFGYWFEKITTRTLINSANFNTLPAKLMARIARYSIFIRG